MTPQELDEATMKIAVELQEKLGRPATALDVHAFLFNDLDIRLENYTPIETEEIK